jgi:hypothetical protein
MSIGADKVSAFGVICGIARNEVVIAPEPFSPGIIHAPGKFRGNPVVLITAFPDIDLVKIGALGNRRKREVLQEESAFGSLTLQITMVHKEAVGVVVRLIDCAAIRRAGSGVGVYQF